MIKVNNYRIKNSIALYSILLSICSCTLIPCISDAGLNYVKENPKPDFIVGTYKFDDWTLNKTQGFRNSQDARLIINENGTFELINIPKGTIDINTLYYSDSKRINARGTWRTYFREGETAKIFMNFKFNLTKVNIEDFETTWGIYEEDGRAVVFISVGDPDECAAVRFLKASTENAKK